MENIEKLKGKLANLENKVKGSQRGRDYTVSTNDKGEKTYNINSQELKEEIFSEFRRGSGLNPAFLESRKESAENPQIDFPNNSFWNNALENNSSSFSPQIREITDEEAKRIEQEKEEKDKTELKEKVWKEDSKIDNQQEVETAHKEWIKIGKQQGWIYTTLPTFFLFFISVLIQ